MKCLSCLAPIRDVSSSQSLAVVFADFLIKLVLTYEFFNLMETKDLTFIDQRYLSDTKHPNDDFLQFIGVVFMITYVILKIGILRHYAGQSLEFSKKMAGKFISYVLVSDVNPSLYAEAFCKIQETIYSGYSFLQTNFHRYCWFIANEPNELKQKQADHVKQESQLLSQKLQLLTLLRMVPNLMVGK